MKSKVVRNHLRMRSSLSHRKRRSRGKCLRATFTLRGTTNRLGLTGKMEANNRSFHYQELNVTTLFLSLLLDKSADILKRQ